MSSTVSQIRTAMKNVLDGHGGLRALDYVPGTVEPPMIFPVPGRPGGTSRGNHAAVTYDHTMANGSTAYTMTLVLVLSNAVDRVGQSNLDDYISPDGPTSIKDKLESDTTLGGVVSYARASEVLDYGNIEWNGVKYLGAQIVVEVIA